MKCYHAWKHDLSTYRTACFAVPYPSQTHIKTIRLCQCKHAVSAEAIGSAKALLIQLNTWTEMHSYLPSIRQLKIVKNSQSNMSGKIVCHTQTHEKLLSEKNTTALKGLYRWSIFSNNSLLEHLQSKQRAAMYFIVTTPYLCLCAMLCTQFHSAWDNL